MATISVIIPVYQAEHFIHDSIKSVLSQSFTDFELILIINGNHQPTIEKINELEDKRIQKIYLEHADVVEAVNQGIEASSANYIARLDADDTMPFDRLQLQYDYLQAHPDVDVVSGKVKYLGDNTQNRGYYLHVKWLNELFSHEQMYFNRFVDAPVANPSLMIRKSVFKKGGLYKKGDFPEDYEMMLRWMHHGVKFGKVNAEVLHWRDHHARATRNHPMYSKEAFMRMKALYLSKWFESIGRSKEILIWGNSRVIRQSANELTKVGFSIKGFIDVKSPSNPDMKPSVFHYSNIPKNLFIISMVSDRKGRKEIHQFLIANGYKEGEDFYMLN